MHNAVPIHFPVSVSVVPSPSVRGVDVGVLGGLDAGGAGRVVTQAAVCRGNVDFGAAATRSSSAGRAAVCQFMNPGQSGVVPSALVESSTVSSNCPRYNLVPAHSTFTPP